jgi:hypothetical protein
MSTITCRTGDGRGVQHSGRTVVRRRPHHFHRGDGVAGATGEHAVQDVEQQEGPHPDELPDEAVAAAVQLAVARPDPAVPPHQYGQAEGAEHGVERLLQEDQPAQRSAAESVHPPPPPSHGRTLGAVQRVHACAAPRRAAHSANRTLTGPTGPRATIPTARRGAHGQQAVIGTGEGTDNGAVGPGELETQRAPTPAAVGHARLEAELGVQLARHLALNLRVT